MKANSPQHSFGFAYRITQREPPFGQFGRGQRLGISPIGQARINAQPHCNIDRAFIAGWVYKCPTRCAVGYSCGLGDYDW
jgi:hypothetical protein